MLLVKVNIKDSELAGIKVVLVGDFHIKPTKKKRSKKVVSLINRLNCMPEISVIQFE